MAPPASPDRLWRRSGGAVAIVIRSIGTDHHRFPHTGTTNFPDGVKPIPAAALSVPDAEQLEQIAARGGRCG